jgi:signal transduction histidine kinase
MHNEPVQAKDIESAYIESTLLGIQELKKNLVTQIAHNFRTPLTSVIGFAEMLLDDRPLTDEQRVEYARFIQYEGIRLSKLIDDVLELSSLENGEARLHACDYVLQDIVADAVARVSDFAHGRLVTVNSDSLNLPIPIRCDREKIGQAIYQLLHNAVRFTKPNDEVTVSVKVVGHTAEIAVRDCGPGIPEEDVPDLFEETRRVHKLEQDTRSTGVGLAIVMRILDLHQGEIRVDSRKGEGSLITLRIPGVQS